MVMVYMLLYICPDPGFHTGSKYKFHCRCRYPMMRPSSMRMMRSVCLAAVGLLGLGLVVGHHQDGLAALLVDLVQELHDLGSHLGVQVTGGLVRKDDGGVSDKGTGDGNSLALTSGKL